MPIYVNFVWNKKILFLTQLNQTNILTFEITNIMGHYTVRLNCKLPLTGLVIMLEVYHGCGEQSIFLQNRQGFSHRPWIRWKLKLDIVLRKISRYSDQTVFKFICMKLVLWLCSMEDFFYFDIRILSYCNCLKNY